MTWLPCSSIYFCPFQCGWVCSLARLFNWLCSENRWIDYILSFYTDWKAKVTVNSWSCSWDSGGIGVSLSIINNNKSLCDYPIGWFHMMSQMPCWRSKTKKQWPICWRVKCSFWNWTQFLWQFFLLFQYANMAAGHMSEHTLLIYQAVFYEMTSLNSWGVFFWGGKWSLFLLT